MAVKCYQDTTRLGANLILLQIRIRRLSYRLCTLTSQHQEGYQLLPVRSSGDALLLRSYRLTLLLVTLLGTKLAFTGKLHLL